MKIGFIVNDVMTEDPRYTTTRLAMAAANMGHTAWTVGVSELAHDPDGSVHARARGPKEGRKYRSVGAFLEDLQDGSGTSERISIDELDVLMLRNDPADDASDRPWAQTSGILFGQLAVRNGVLVLNDPAHLADAINKTYFQHFPEKVRPLTLITRDPGEIKAFVESCSGKAVLKPLQGSGGHGVFLVNTEEAPNLNQIIETLTDEGYVVAQEYLKAGRKGDTRLFVMNGRPLEKDGRFAAFRRVNKSSDVRSNMRSGGKLAKATVTDEMLRIVEMVRPKLLSDGMFLVGLDIVGDKLMEINVFSPGGLGSAKDINKVDFPSLVIEAIEEKLALRESYERHLDNATLASL